MTSVVGAMGLVKFPCVKIRPAPRAVLPIMPAMAPHPTPSAPVPHPHRPALDAAAVAGDPGSTGHSPAPARLARVGCVSYLNAKPLIEGLAEAGDVEVQYDVPSRLCDDLVTGAVDLALCSIIDYFRTPGLRLVPVGGIGCLGRTLTVRLFSRDPIAQLTQIHADTDSHTSVALLRVVLAEQFNITPELVPFRAANYDYASHLDDPDRPRAMLLIGDKVVTRSPKAVEFPHQLDLGEAWRALTDLPFVFAMWMTRQEVDLGPLPARLDALCRANDPRRAAIAMQHAQAHRWPTDLAQHYLAQLLHYEIGPEQLTAVRRFADLAHRHGVIDHPRPLDLYPCP